MTDKNDNDMQMQSKPTDAKAETPEVTSSEPTTSSEEAVSQAGGGQMTVERIEGSERDPDASMLAMLKKRPDGDVWVAKAEALAAEVSPEGMVSDEGNAKLLGHVQPHLDAIGNVANEMIGNRRMGDAGDIGKLFSSLSDAKDELKIGEITAPEPFLAKLPFGLGNRFKPIVAFAERYQRIKPKIDGKEQTLADLIAERITAEGQIEGLKTTILDGFLEIEVAIAAGEIAWEASKERFNADVAEMAGSQDLVELQKLKDRRLMITSLDNRLMRLQASRMRAVVDLAVLDKSRDVQRSLKATLEDLKGITINEIRKGVAIALNIYDARQAAALAGDVGALNQALMEANVDALGMAQEEVHQAAVQGAAEAQRLVKVFEKFDQVLQRGNELVRENERLNSEARDTLQNLEGDFKKSVRENLEDLAKPIGEDAQDDNKAS